MTMRFSTSRLFWKLFLAIWMATMLTFVCGALYIMLSGQHFPEHPRSGVPWVPVLSASLANGLVSMGLAWYLSLPLRHLRWALRRVADAQFDTRILPLMGARRDEIVDLAGEFDSMAARLQLLTQQRQQLFHDVSHELRSPLARMQAAIGLMRQNPAQTEPMVERIECETQRMDVLIEELLTFHRLEAGTPISQRSRTDVIELLTAIAHDASFEASMRGCSVEFSASDEFVAEVDGELIYRAFENVIRNAVKYTAPGSSVRISACILEDTRSASAASPATRMLQVTVQDQGPGVPAQFCERIFEPFQRLEDMAPILTPARAVPGTGLGLAIARRAIAAHGGTIRAFPGSGGGLCVRILIPSN